MDGARIPATQGLMGWPSFPDTVRRSVAGVEWVPRKFREDRQLDKEFDAYLNTIAAMTYWKTWYNDPRYPDFWPSYHCGFPIGFNNPDDVYLIAAVDDDGVYRLSGHRGTVHILAFEVGSMAMQSWGFGEYAPTLDQYEPDSHATVADDGTFDVVLSRTRPEGYRGDWWELKEGALYVMVRKRSYDWAGEIDARVAIERLDVAAMRPRRTAEEIAWRIARHPESSENWAKKMLEWFTRLEDEGLENRLTSIYVHGGGIPAQYYHAGIFDLAADEALVIDTEVPASRYWMYHLTDQMMTTLDQLHRHSSLNGFQVELDPDGRFRAVVSAVDPGVPNWLDTNGHLRGSISGRWWTPAFEPAPVVTKVRLDELDGVLHPGTRKVGPGERDATVRARRRAMQLRGRW